MEKDVTLQSEKFAINTKYNEINKYNIESYYRTGI